MDTVSSAAVPERPRRRHAADRRPEVLAALRDDGGFLSAQGLHATMKQRGIRIGLTTVYRALSAADAEGRLEAVYARSGAKAYRYLPPVHEHHLTCRVCGAGAAFFCQGLEDWVAQLGPRHGFEDVRHAVAATGTCPGCASDGAG
ncbi:MAG TPA: transcriptional repressor [Streptomyces sp.]|uniref:Fur family transcriptional regulator n=1 Tax=Streptomyces sp. TaxID=1931 RepID=UPI002D0FE1D8|nr:transcriptional repressor [Streptomyces sp.]HWU05147.1 transcriptional repressor [Streptomyces sp.]